MRTIRQPDSAYVYTISAEHPPIARVACNESVLIETMDAFEGRLSTSRDLYSQKCPGPPWANSQTRPIFIEVAKPGDTLVFHIDHIEPTQSFAITALIPEFGGLTGTSQSATLGRPLPESTRIPPIDEGGLRFNETISLPLEPFIGTLGTAPDLEANSSLLPGYWGGNME